MLSSECGVSVEIAMPCKVLQLQARLYQILLHVLVSIRSLTVGQQRSIAPANVAIRNVVHIKYERMIVCAAALNRTFKVFVVDESKITVRGDKCLQIQTPFTIAGFDLQMITSPPTVSTSGRADSSPR